MASITKCKFIDNGAKEVSTVEGGPVEHETRKHRSPLRRHIGDNQRDGGFTLIELLISMTLLPLVIGALSVAMISVFTMQAQVSGRLAGSLDLQTAMATFVRDVQSANQITTGTGLACSGNTGSGAPPTQLLGLQWASGDTVVSYGLVPMVNGSTPALNYSVDRWQCSYGGHTPSTTTVIATNVTAQQVGASLCLTATTCLQAPQTSWVDAASLTMVQLPLVVGGSSTTTYTLTATPRARYQLGTNLSPSSLSAPIVLSGATSCNSGSAPALSLKNNSTLSVNVGGGISNGLIEILSPCAGSICVTNGSQINPTSVGTYGGGILAGSGSALSTSGNCSNGGFPTISTYTTPANSVTLSTLTVPSVQSQTCFSYVDQSGTAQYFCPPGSYATYSFPTQSVVNFYGGGPFVFPNGLSIGQNVNVNFGPGIYYLEGSGTALSTGNGATITGQSALLYASDGGSISFANSASIHLTPPGINDGATVWINGSGSGGLTLGNNSTSTCSTASYGGVYVPQGTVTLGTSGNTGGMICVSYIVAASLSIQNGTTIQVQP